MKSDIRIPTVTFFCDHYINHNSFIISGLCDLAAVGKIRLDFRLWRPIASDRNYWITYVVVKYPSGKITRISFDFHDFSNFYCSKNLAISDLYYRANYSQSVVDSMVNRKHAAKMRPFGLYFAPRPNKDQAVVLRYIGSMFSAVQKYGIGSFVPTSYEKLYALYTQVYINYFANYRHKLRAAQYNSSGKKSAGPVIFFNPRCWPAKEDSVQQINDTRAEIIRKCKRRFGDKFLGGFINTEYARKNYPTEVLERHIPHSEYIRLVKSAHINIYTQGMNNCISWKLLEYLAAGSAVVGERISNDLPVDELREDIFLPFSSPIECVERIAELLQEPDRLLAIQQASHEWYMSHLSPVRKMERIILENEQTG